MPRLREERLLATVGAHRLRRKGAPLLGLALCAIVPRRGTARAFASLRVPPFRRSPKHPRWGFGGRIQTGRINRCQTVWTISTTRKMTNAHRPHRVIITG